MKCLTCGMANSETNTYCKKCHSYLTESPSIEYLNTFKALILGLFCTGLFYFVFPMPIIKNDYLYQLFSGRISETIFSLILWSLFLIFFKWLKIRQQLVAYESFRDKDLHNSLSSGIFIKDVEKRILEISQFLENKKIKKFQNSIIFRRVRRTLLHLKAVPKKEEITSILNYQAEIDHNKMLGGYTILNVFI